VSGATCRHFARCSCVWLGCASAAALQFAVFTGCSRAARRAARAGAKSRVSFGCALLAPAHSRKALLPRRWPADIVAAESSPLVRSRRRHHDDAAAPREARHERA